MMEDIVVQNGPSKFSVLISGLANNGLIGLPVNEPGFAVHRVLASVEGFEWIDRGAETCKLKIKIHRGGMRRWRRSGWKLVYDMKLRTGTVVSELDW